jgi:biopolymer transport protein ExbD
MARKPSERRHAKEVDGELNLAPIMSILVILIPVLIFAFTFFEVKIQQVSAPKMGPPKQTKKEDDQKKPLHLTVEITENGFNIKQSLELTTEPDKPIPKRNFVDTSGEATGQKGKEYKEYDYPALYTRLAKKKKMHKDERTINIGADFDIHWQTIARTIDAARSQLEESSYADMENYTMAKPKMDKDKVTPLAMFDTVVFTVN